MRWRKILKRYDNYDVVILISHEGSLEAFLENQEEYEVEYKSFDRYFEYGDFGVFTK